jgi:hypothetical protein
LIVKLLHQLFLGLEEATKISQHKLYGNQYLNRELPECIRQQRCSIFPVPQPLRPVQPVAREQRCPQQSVMVPAKNENEKIK